MNYMPGICTFCGTGCGHFLKTTGSRVQGVFPARQHPVSKGRLCVRGWNIHELLAQGSRLKEPFLRRGGGLETVRWEEALGHLVDRVRACGHGTGREIAVLGSPRASNEECYLLMRLARSILRTNCISVDSESGHGMGLSVLAEGTGFPGMLGSFEAIRDCRFLLTVDYDVAKLNPIVGSELHMAARQGATLVTIDSRRTQIARLSRRFLQVRPGTTGLALAGLARLIADASPGVQAGHSGAIPGWNEFTEVLAGLQIEEVTARTGVSFEALRQTAAELHCFPSAMAFFPSGISGLTEDAVRWLFNLFLLAGKIGKPASGINPVAGLNNLQGAYDMGLAPQFLTGHQTLEDLSVRRRFEQCWGGELPTAPSLPVYDRLEEPEPVKVLFVIDHDEGIVRYADRIREAETVVFIGAFDNPFVEYADIVLPVCTYAETDGTFTNAERRVQLSRKKAEPPSGVPAGWQLYCQIAHCLGTEWKFDSAREVMEEIASLTPAYAVISHEKLSRNGGIQWPCTPESPDGTAQYLAEEHSFKPQFVRVPRDFDLPQPAEGYPFLLMVGKAQHFWHQNNLMKQTFIPMREYNATLLLYPEGFVEICPEDARELGVRDRWMVKVSSSAGSMEIAVRVSEDVRPKTAYVPYFIREMIGRFLLEHRTDIRIGENASIPVRIERIQ